MRAILRRAIFFTMDQLFKIENINKIKTCTLKKCNKILRNILNEKYNTIKSYKDDSLYGSYILDEELVKNYTKIKKDFTRELLLDFIHINFKFNTYKSITAYIITNNTDFNHIVESLSINYKNGIINDWKNKNIINNEPLLVTATIFAPSIFYINFKDLIHSYSSKKDMIFLFHCIDNEDKNTIKIFTRKKIKYDVKIYNDINEFLVEYMYYNKYDNITKLFNYNKNKKIKDITIFV